MTHPPGHLVTNPLPPGIVGALGLGGYQLLAEVGGVGVGRLGRQVFLVVAPDPDPNLPNAGTQIALHHAKVKNESDVAAFTQLAAQLGYWRLSGYRLALERDGLRTNINLVNPATGAVLARIPARHPGGLSFSSAATAAGLLATVRALPPAGPPPDTQDPELLRQVLLALALQDEATGGAEAAELADRALELSRADRQLDPPAALALARGAESA
ncbi:MAG TPA: hypothetical protein VG295_03655 [Solirubrobacteraceae bacterium]|jgi:hypothetical protein|nr:hypothetical protein [Solirubrobacteraceae bacterium]